MSNWPSVPFFHPGKDSPEAKYLAERRTALGGSLPQRRQKSDETLQAPELKVFERLLQSSGERENSTRWRSCRRSTSSCATSRLAARGADRADEARTFGMEGLFRQIGIYAPFGQKYKR